MFPTYDLEVSLKKEGFKYIVGVDEVGRGCGSGPVVAAAVIIPDKSLKHLIGVANDSKKLSAKKREHVHSLIVNTCSVGYGVADNKVIDKINILQATKKAMVEALSEIGEFDYVLVDGTVDLSKYLVCPCQQVIKGDAISVSIASASIVAKVIRDKMMNNLHLEYPYYGWDRNKGYLTKEHISAIKEYGLTNYHRETFGICRDYVNQ